MYKYIVLIPAYEPDEKLIELVNKIPSKLFDIVIVNDGSDKSYNEIFDKCKKAHIISYSKNMGKGYALKEGYYYIKEKYKKNYIIVTTDCDGQHTIEDATKLCDYIKDHNNELVLGKRLRSKKTPLRSRFGNEITTIIFKLTTKVYVYDTQTGLRAFSDKLIDIMTSIDGNRFEYEMNVLLECTKRKIPIHEEVIETIYIDKNSKSHFSPIKDSIKVYKSIIKYLNK